MKLEFSGQIFRKNTQDTGFHENPSSWSGQTDGHDEANSARFTILRMRVRNGSFPLRVLLAWIVFCSLLTMSLFSVQCTSSLHLRLISI